MKKILLGITILLTVSGCNGPSLPKGRELLIYRGIRWDIIKLNDSICIIMPTENAEEGDTPQTINLKNVQ